MLTGIIIAPIVTVFALHKFCDTGWLRASISAILFTIWLVVWPVMGMFLLTKLTA